MSISGLVFTIDGHMVVSPLTGVTGGTTPTSIPSPRSWQVGNPSYFYDASRAITLDRTGSFISIYDLNGVKICQAIILDPNEIISSIQFLKFLPIRFFNQFTWIDLDPNNGQVRLEDNFKFCTDIPSWIPLSAESRSRWLPVMSKDMDFSVGQRIDIKGGIASVDGITIPIVYAQGFQGNNGLQRFFREDAEVYIIEETNPLAPANEYPLTAYDYIDPQDSLIKILDQTANPFYVGDIPVPMNSRPNYPWVSATTTDLTLDLQEPTFIDAEATIIDTLISSVVDPGGNGDLNTYSLARGIDSTRQAYHFRYCVLYNGMPFAIGQTVKLWEVDNFNSPLLQNWNLSYVGLLENIKFDNGLAAFSLEISSNLWTQQVNSTNDKDSSKIIRLNKPTNSDKRFFSRFLITQINPEDKFRWVKIGKICVPIRKIINFDYREVIVLGDSDAELEYKRDYGVFDLDQKLQKNISEGTEDFGYQIGFIDQFGVFKEVNSFSVLQDGSVSPPITIYVGNTFNLDQDNPAENFVPRNTTWGIHTIELAANEEEHDVIYEIRSTSRRRSSQLTKAQKYFNEEEVSLVHLFEPFCLGLDEGDVAAPYQRFYYTVKEGNEDRPTAIANAYSEVNVIDVILQVLTSTGTGDFTVIPYSAGPPIVRGNYEAVPGINGAFDICPSDFALGIPNEYIDFDSFYEILRNRGERNLRAKSLYYESGVSTLKFLEEQILKPFFLSLATSSTGIIILIDVADVVIGPGVKSINEDDFVRPSGSATSVGLSYDAEDLSDSFSFSWKEPWLPEWIDPRIRNTEKILGNSARNATLLFAGRGYTIPARTAIFKNIQSSPIVYDLKFAPLEPNKVVDSAQNYLLRFNRIVPRATFELFWDYDAPDIGDKVSFNLPAIPNKEGISSNLPRIIIGKIIDIRINRRTKVANYTALLTDSTIATTDTLWSLTAEILSVDTGLDTITVSTNLFSNGASAIINDGINQFQNDWDQFGSGDRIIIWDENWRYITDTDILVNNNGVIEISDPASAGWVGYRITLETRANYAGVYEGFLAWLNTGQKLL